MGRGWPEKRRDDGAQREYLQTHDTCLWCGGGGANVCHEIIFGSSMSYDWPWNFTALHTRCHEIIHNHADPKRARRRLFAHKILLDEIPDDMADDIFRWVWYGKN